MTKAEQETIIRWDQEERVLHFYTAYPPEARRWERLGYEVEVVDSRKCGEPRGWRADAPLDALRLRKLVDGRVQGRRRGRSFRPGSRRLAAPGHANSNDRPVGLAETVNESVPAN